MIAQPPLLYKWFNNTVLFTGGNSGGQISCKYWKMTPFECTSHCVSFKLPQFNGHNLLKVHAKDAGAYGRALLDILFTKEEQLGRCILRTPLNPDKPLLDQDKVHMLFGKLACILSCHYTAYMLLFT